MAQLDPSLDRLVIGPLEGRSLQRHELLIRSPGVSPYRPELVEARTPGCKRPLPAAFGLPTIRRQAAICITGTKGKSTTTALVAHLLRAAGVRAEVAGNIGRPLLDCGPGQADWWVVELSSYQICDLQARPRMAAVLNISDEHVDWHQGRDNYRRDKLRLTDMVRADNLVVNHADAELRSHCEGLEKVCWFEHPAAIHTRNGGAIHGDKMLLAAPPPGLPGRHNLSNLAAALTIAGRIAPTTGRFAGRSATFRALAAPP